MTGILGYDDTTYPDFILLGDTLSDAHNESNFVFNSLDDRVGGGRGRDIEHGGIRLDHAHRLRKLVEHLRDKRR